MNDIIYIGIAALFFGLSWWFVRFADGLLRRNK
jgi:hypothetical protein